jgi:lipooligosaccharide transport system permease protein
MRSWQSFDPLLNVLTAVLLFAAPFFRLWRVRGAVAWVVEVTPLYHGVALLRQLTLGGVEWSALGHVAYLAALGTAGVLVAGRRLERRLLR